MDVKDLAGSESALCSVGGLCFSVFLAHFNSFQLCLKELVSLTAVLPLHSFVHSQLRPSPHRPLTKVVMLWCIAVRDAAACNT